MQADKIMPFSLKQDENCQSSLLRLITPQYSHILVHINVMYQYGSLCDVHCWFKMDGQVVTQFA